MHRIWTILEVVGMIASNAQTMSTLSSLAQTSRVCFQAAAPVLWRELDDTNLNLFGVLFVKGPNGDPMVTS
ncbi:hypothetical protein CALCODRAFT_321818 [Calocera cornea HHB12733]|uniref:Uncharacterized protein n=1 Tax=Calocera cornea HHB12733 TaxID=1353952 RepID=A0A165F6I3_9BASI|nr:hypothetical protein CALCODRAFT_321818 [Calocera cornea HHB12733]